MGMFGLSRGGAQTTPRQGQGQGPSPTRGGDAEDPAYGARDPAYEQSVSASAGTSAPAPTSPRGSARRARLGALRLLDGGRAHAPPLLAEEHMRGVRKDILRVMDKRTVVVLDPDDGKRYLRPPGTAARKSGGTRTTARLEKRRRTKTCTNAPARF